MHTFFSHLSSLQQSQLASITDTIRKAVRPEKIILFGVFAEPSGNVDLYSGREFPAFAASYEILVITSRPDERKDHAIQDILENRCRFLIPVNVLVHDIRHVNACLASGHPFFWHVSREGRLLFDAGRTRLIDGQEPDLAVVLHYAREDFGRWWARANAFFQGAVHSRERCQAPVAMFLLHQAAEQAYQAIMLSFTRYKPTTHNLDKLRRHTNRFSIGLATLFPRNTPEEDHYFKLLLSSYIDARYDPDFSITDEELDLLTDRVSQLLAIAQRICRNQFILLAKLATQAA